MITIDGYEIDSNLRQVSCCTIYFVDISPRLSESGLRFSLIYFWEARNTANGGSCSSSTNQGMIDFLCNFLHVDSHSNFLTSYWFRFRQGTVIYQPQLKPGSTYSLKNLFATKPKEIYRVADLRVTICFSHSSVLFHLEYLSTPTGSDSTYMKVLSPTVVSETVFSLSAMYLMHIIELLF